MQTLVHVKINAQFIPLRSVIKMFSELPEIYNDTMKYLQFLQSNNDIITNLVHASFWQERLLTHGDKVVVPIIMSWDEYENNNPLGSHKGLCKTKAVYIGFPALPPDTKQNWKTCLLYYFLIVLTGEFSKIELYLLELLKNLIF